MGATDPHAAEIVRMGYYTGMRFGEITGLTWDRVNMAEGYVSLRPEDTKTSKPRKVYLLPQAVEVLERVRKVRGLSHRHVFTYKGRPVKQIKTTLKTALQKTGIDDFRLHDLRHTFNTNMQRAGVRNTVIMDMTGHKTLSMFLRYTSVDQRDSKEAVSKLSSYLEKAKTTTSQTTSHAKRGHAQLT